MRVQILLISVSSLCLWIYFSDGVCKFNPVSDYCCKSETPMMDPDSVKLFNSVLSQNSRVYFEWGSGASTSFAAHRSRYAVSIESGAPWYSSMLKKSSIQCLLKTYKLTYTCIGAGPTAVAALPHARGVDNRFLDRDQIDSIFARQPRIAASQIYAWQAYVSVIDLYNQSSIGVVLVDGRFRVACALKALAHMVASNGTLLLHDARRPPYTDIFKYYDVIAEAGQLVALKPKPVLPHQYQAAWKKYVAHFA